MEQIAPKLASAAKILGLLLIIATAVNLKINLWGNSGISLEEYATIFSSVLLLIIAYFASKKRQVVKLTDNLSLEEQFAQLESTPTNFASVAITNTNQSIHTKGIIDSILGAKAQVNEQRISQAIDTLSKGDFGQVAQSMAEQLPAPHKNAEMVVESPVTDATNNDFSTVANLPRPKITGNIDAPAPDLPNTKINSITAIEYSAPKSQSVADANDLIAEETGELIQDYEYVIKSGAPDLPDIDELF